MFIWRLRQLCFGLIGLLASTIVATRCGASETITSSTAFTTGSAATSTNFELWPKFDPSGAAAAAKTASPAPPEDGQWPMAAKNYQNTRYSGLKDINTSNVAALQPAWTFSTGVLRGQEAAPIVVGDTLYIVTPYPNVLYALDLKANGALKWKYSPEPDPAAQGVACCDTVNRGAVYDNGKVFINTLDDHTIAVDAVTGKELWKTKLGDINKGETMTMSPLVVKGKVLVGNSGGEFGVRGWLTALDENTGKIAWRAYSTGVDKDCLIGPDFKPFYKTDQGKDLGVATWPPDQWQLGGGTVWGFVSYDPDLDLVYYGMSNPGVWNQELRPGDNKWSCGVFARNPETGQARWYYQWSPHDLYDHDGVNESIVLDLPIGGAGTKPRKVIVHPDRNGFMYVLDRETGQVLSADPFVRITTAKGVDLKTGRLIPVDEKIPRSGKVVRDVAPTSPGAKDWQPCAYSHQTGLLYVPNQNMSEDFEGTEANYIAGTPYVGANVKMYPGPGGNRGEFSAWDPVARQKVWTIKERFPVWSGAVATAGGLVFYGTMEGWFKGVDAETGKVLWKFKTGSGISGQPSVFRGPNGKEYVAVMSGVGGWAGAVVSGDLDPKDGTAALGFANAMKDLPSVTEKGGTLYVFALP